MKRALLRGLALNALAVIGLGTQGTEMNTMNQIFLLNDLVMKVPPRPQPTPAIL